MLLCCQGVKTYFCETRLLPGGCRAGRGRSRGLRCAQIARGGSLGDLVNHQFQSRAVSASVEEDRLIHGAILLLEAVVVCQDVDGVTVLFGVSVLQLDADGANLCRTALALHGELEVIALAHAAELIDFIMVPRDERAHLAARHLDTVLGSVQITLYAGDVAIQPGNIVAAGFGGPFRLYGSRQVV